MPEDYQMSLAVMDEAEVYRYRLARTWDIENKKTTVFVMLNPSTADQDVDDPTIRRCVGFAKSNGSGKVEIVNLFAYRATKPEHLALADDPVGNQNDYVIRQLFESDFTGPVIVGWGGSRHKVKRVNSGHRVGAVMDLAKETNRPLYCFGETKNGDPRHPLYLPKDAEMHPFPIPVYE